MATSPFLQLPAYDDETETWNVVVDTPRGSRNKYKLDEKTGLFRLGGVLSRGMSFPFDFGYVPATLGADGDPLDVLVLMDEPAFVGCVLAVRLVGVIEADQTEGRKTERNDRLIGVSDNYHEHESLKSIADFSPTLLDEIEHFFIAYNQARGRTFKPLGRHGPARAEKLVKAGMKEYQKE